METTKREELSSKICPDCSSNLVLEMESCPLGSAMQLRRFHVDVYRCPKCDRVLLFSAQSKTEICPVCGSSHPKGQPCVICAINSAFDHREE